MKTFKLHKLNRKQKNLFLLLIILIIAVIVSLIILISDSSSTINQNFHIDAIETVSKIVIKDKNNHTLTLTKTNDSVWMVDGKFEANNILISTVLETLKTMRIREPLPKAARNNVVKDLATLGKKVDIYITDYKIDLGIIKLFKEEHLKTTYYVGTETPDEMGTFMLKKGDDVPYVIHIPNFRGYLSSRFSAIADLWRTHNVFRYKQSEIASINVQLPSQVTENFTLINNGNGFTFLLADGSKLNVFDTNKVLAFLSSFVDMNYERIATNIPKVEQDTIFSKLPSFIITVKDKKGKIQTLKTFVKLNDPNSIATDEYDFYQIFDINRCYALSNRYADTLIMQFFTLDNVLKPASYFFIGAAGKPYIK
ncbi:MAG: DUF4340 domain-containing protein [Bacteroidales bacterium]